VRIYDKVKVNMQVTGLDYISVFYGF